MNMFDNWLKTIHKCMKRKNFKAVIYAWIVCHEDDALPMDNQLCNIAVKAGIVFG